MKLVKIWLNGYGRFFKRTLELSPGLQVILGPNEQGKTTVRSFIGDMLYGQKRSSAQRLYDEAHELRRPWSTPTCYGGQIVYRLDDGREIEVHRNFDRKQESVQVFDLTHGREITGEFELLRNRELNFAQAHLGLSKTVFLSTASIGHMSLENLGDADALIQIREKLLSLADTGGEDGSSDTALKRLETRQAAMGRNGAKSKPLPAARARLAELEEECGAALALRHELASLDLKRREALDRAEMCRRRRAALEDELRLHERVERARRYHEAQKLASAIDEATRKCFALGSVREFPLEQQHEVQRAANLVATARAQLQRSEAERQELHRQLEDERQRLGPAADYASVEIPEDAERRLAELEPIIDRLRERLEEAEAAVQAVERRVQEAQSDLDRLPDFSRLAGEPVAWLNQLANSFRLAQHSREKERETLRRLRGQVAHQRAEVAGPERLFAERPTFLAEARDYQILQKVFAEQEAHLLSQLEELQAAAEEHENTAPGLRLMAILLLAGALASAGAALLFDNWGMNIPAVLAATGFLSFLYMYTEHRRSGMRARQALRSTQDELDALRADYRERSAPMEHLIVAAGCSTLRELEALYEKYREDRTELVALTHALEAQEAKAIEEDERVEALYANLVRTFRQTGETLTHEREVPQASARAIARYQEYRDAKRRSAESRELLAHRRVEMKKLKEQLDEHLKEDLSLSLAVRRVMRENGFPEEMRYDSALNALRAFRLRMATLRQKRGRIEVLQEKMAALERRIEAERKDLERHDEAMARYLRRAGVHSVEEWQERAEQAATYRELWRQRSALKQQLDALLLGEDLEVLRQAVVSGEPLPITGGRSVEELRRDIDEMNQAVEEAQKEAHALHIAFTERSAGLRSLNEIEEERAEIVHRIQDLEFESRAVAFAAEVIEREARERHARIAPRLAQVAGEYLREITGGAYEELLISRDLTVSIRIPQTSQLNNEPERRLSKGTVDQIYLALRLAMIQNLNDYGESVPMLLDDPFANYDDVRLERAMRLLMRVAQRSQILLFTCREDVARVAESVGAPVLKL